MELTNRFRVPAPVDEAWALLTDVERIAPCLPGAQLTEVDGDEYRGLVKVKVGPITAQYRGTARFAVLDDAGHRAVLRAEGRETRGQGNAAATVTAELTPESNGAGGTLVSVVADLSITGKVAQFGRGVLADVSSKLLDQFATSLEAMLAGEGQEGRSDDPATHAPVEPSSSRPTTSPDVEPINLLGTVGIPLIRRVGPLLAVVAGLWLVARLIRR